MIDWAEETPWHRGSAATRAGHGAVAEAEVAAGGLAQASLPALPSNHQDLEKAPVGSTGWCSDAASCKCGTEHGRLC